ncbi:NADPH:quinone reductase [Roseiconus nitratireducens]|uniref:NADPH:quinone reductase n=1 Tax=Roseiconus nitratireducens TaxID=2605748 RepID=A0A5M6DKT1_9BACT|nr:NADPH:quinone reductase [Roseiconus nitratireducens]KAA5545945.1 NADPH:quinone reductase [Roseiconus nitratireducens]
MKAAFLDRTGSPDVIQYSDLDDPVPGPGQVLIRNHAVSVNPIDTYVRAGIVAFDLPQPFVVGCDAAGVIEAVGSEVNGFSAGDRVWCTNQGVLGRQGTFSEMLAVDQQWCFPLPDSVDYESAAANALVGVTAHLGLFRCAQLKAAETLLVIGGSGGVGSMVVQMAKAVGAKVITTAGSAEKCDRASRLGADHVIDYSKQSIADAVKELAPDGVNVFWETRREPDFDLAIGALAQRGRMVLMAGRDARPEFPVGPFYVNECSLHGFVMFKAAASEMKACAEDMNRWMESGQLKSNVAQTLPLSEAAEAHRLQEAGGVGGKIVLTV